MSPTSKSKFSFNSVDVELRSDSVKIDNKCKFQNFSIVERIKDLDLLSNLKDQKTDRPTTPPPSPSLLDMNDDDHEYGVDCAPSDYESMATPPGTPTHDQSAASDTGFLFVLCASER